MVTGIATKPPVLLLFCSLKTVAFATLTVVRRSYTVCGWRISLWNATKAVTICSTHVRKLELGLHLKVNFSFTKHGKIPGREAR